MNELEDQDKQSLRWMTYDDDHTDPPNGWGHPAAILSGENTCHSPALAYFPVQNSLYCAYIGASDGDLYYTAYAAEWNDSQRLIRDQAPARADDSPALASHKELLEERLHCVRLAGDKLLATSTENGQVWNPDTPLSVVLGDRWEGPALTSHNSRLYCAYTSFQADKPHWWWTRYEHNAWQKARDSGFTCLGRPALASFRGSLHCVYSDLERDDSLMCSVFGETNLTWSTPMRVSATDGMGIPTVAVHGKSLHCFNAVYGKNQEFQWQILNEDGQWLKEAMSVELPPEAPWIRLPALATYLGQLRCVYATNG